MTASSPLCSPSKPEIHALNNAFYDLERFGLRFVASPRHADVLLVTGPVTKNMREALQRTYAATPDPKWVVAVGDCAVDGGGVLRELCRGGCRRESDPGRSAHPGLPAAPDPTAEGIACVAGGGLRTLTPLHRHHLRGRRARRDRFRWREAPAGRPARCNFGRDQRKVCLHVLAGRAGRVGNASGSARPRPACHRARSRHRRSIRRGLRPAPSLAGIAGGSGWPVRGPVWLADGGPSSRAAAERPGPAGRGHYT
jgi:Ni,Fe-hydrogenase III small subunit